MLEPVTTTLSTEVAVVKTSSLWWLVVLGIASAVFSISMFFWQAAHHTDQLSGKIVTIMDSRVMIVDMRGKVTTLTITPDTTIHTAKLTTKSAEPVPPKNDINQLVIGQIVHTFGTVTPTGEFISSDIRVMDHREPKMKN